MRSRYLFRMMFAILVLCALLMPLGGRRFVAAQDDGPRRIPVVGEFIVTELSPDGTTLAVYEMSSAHDFDVVFSYLPIRLFDLATGDDTRLIGHTDYAVDVAFTPDGERLVSTHMNGEIIVWDIATSAILNRYATPIFHNRGVAVLPDGVTAMVNISSSDFPAYAEWDLTNGTVKRFLTPGYAWYTAYLNLMPWNGMDIVFNISPDATKMVAGAANGIVSVWDLETGKVSALVPPSDDRPSPRWDVRMTDYALDGSAIAYYHEDQALLHVIEADSGAEIRTIAADARSTPTLSPDRTLAAWITAEEVIQVADLASGDIVAEFAAPVEDNLVLRPGPITNSGLHFTPDNAQLIVAGYVSKDGSNAVWVIDLALP